MNLMGVFNLRWVKVLVLGLIQCLILFVSIRNIFPEHYIYAGYDFPMQIDPLKKGIEYMQFWVPESLGSVSVVYPYGVYYILIGVVNKLLNFSFSQQSFTFYFLFLTLSFWLSYVGFRFYFSGKNIWWGILFAFLYTFNQYTYYVFYFQWAFSPFLYLYPFLPLYFGLYKNFLDSAKPQRYLPLAVIPLISLSMNFIWGNMPFFIGLMLVSAFFGFSYYIILRQFPLKTFIFKSIVWYLTFVLPSAWGLFPQILRLAEAYHTATTAQIIYDLKDWVVFQALKFPRPFMGVPPLDAYYDFSANMTKMLLYFVLPALLLLGISFLSYKRQVSKELLLAFFMYVFIIVLNNKGVGLLSADIIWYFFRSPALLPLRSFDKTLIFVMYFSLLSLFLILITLPKVWRSLFIALVILAQLGICYPLLLGWTQTKKAYLNEPGKDYRTSQYHSLVKIPDDYFKIADIVNNDTDDFRIFALPYTAGIPGFVNFPAWGVLGNNPLAQLYSRPLVHINEYALSYLNWNYGKVFNETNPQNSIWLLKLLQTQNTKYIILHKDVEEKYFEASNPKIDHYLKSGYITRIYSGPNAELYKLNSTIFINRIYIPSKVLFVPNSMDNYPELLNDIPLNESLLITSLPTEDLSPDVSCLIGSKKFSDTKYKIQLSRSCTKVPVVFSEMYDENWKLISGSGKEVGKHISANGYANSWLVAPQEVCSSSQCDLFIEYVPNRSFFIWLAFSMISSFALFTWFIVIYRKGRI